MLTRAWLMRSVSLSFEICLVCGDLSRISCSFAAQVDRDLHQVEHVFRHTPFTERQRLLVTRGPRCGAVSDPHRSAADQSANRFAVFSERSER